MSAHQKSHAASEPATAADNLPTVSDEVASADRVAGAAAADPAPDIPALLEKAKAEAAELRDAWLRARAEMENMRKQAAADVARAHKYGIERFAGELLAVKDSLESSLAAENATPQALRAGVELTLKQLAAAFEKAKLVEIDPKGEKFDPHRHQAMAMVDSPEPPNTVAQVFQKGYLLADRVLRPAMVAVSKPRTDGSA
jgi:molecular chaperone GrpE